MKTFDMQARLFLQPGLNRRRASAVELAELKIVSRNRQAQPIVIVIFAFYGKQDGRAPTLVYVTKPSLRAQFSSHMEIQTNNGLTTMKKPPHKYRLFYLMLAGLLFAASNAHATNQDAVDALLAQDSAPFGVVFEIVESDGDALQWAIPAINGYVRQLRERFPDIGLAVVSHGREEFALMKSEQADNADVHKAVQSLVADDVPVHVCGTHASWRGKTAADFPDYVDVTPAGPTEIKNYEAMGYILIELKKP